MSTISEQLGRRGPSRFVRPVRRDWLFAVAVGLASIPLAFVAQGDNAHTPDVTGWILFGLSALTLAWRRHYPMGVLLALIVVEGTYHSLGNAHSALIVVTMVSIYSLAVAGPRRRTLIVVPSLLGLSVIMLLSINPERGVELLRIAGWILACALTGEAVRAHRTYVGAIVERAERAERTREEEARRRVAEERLRIARDLHDLLAHSITLIGVQTSVAAHVLATDPERLDRETVAKALEDIADTCRTARGELRTTLEVLREQDGAGDVRGPLPGLDGLSDLFSAARLAGAKVEQTVRVHQAPPAVGAAAYRIVQEALTNAVRHAGPETSVSVELYEEQGALRVAVTDDGAGPGGGSGTPGFGLVGMRERARSVGGTLDAGPRAEGGFAVTAVLPLTTAVGDATR
ncbi:histidine kinase [Streptomyces sp. S.PB5]|uniref:sensor histidine kinase n=1 Tax=Streptomyces sp. S.PB5 TaxID=3020844 RepID=UPI0025B1E96F|nr:histidine kinase [Streptomyces sp. S.PB5]MDN3020324.1 histidine kinase [Streptomyces sp. S.PB5]